MLYMLAHADTRSNNRITYGCIEHNTKLHDGTVSEHDMPTALGYRAYGRSIQTETKVKTFSNDSSYFTAGKTAKKMVAIFAVNC